MNNPPHFILAAFRAARNWSIAKALHALKFSAAAFASISIGWHYKNLPGGIFIESAAGLLETNKQNETQCGYLLDDTPRIEGCQCTKGAQTTRGLLNDCLPADRHSLQLL